MPVSGVVVTMAADEEMAVAALETIRSRKEFEPGQRTGPWVPVVVEAESEKLSRELYDWLLAVPGVKHVDVVYVEFNDGGGSEPKPRVMVASLEELPSATR